VSTTLCCSSSKTRSYADACLPLSLPALPPCSPAAHTLRSAPALRAASSPPRSMPQPPALPPPRTPLSPQQQQQQLSPRRRAARCSWEATRRRQPPCPLTPRRTAWCPCPPPTCWPDHLAPQPASPTILPRLSCRPYPVISVAAPCPPRPPPGVLSSRLRRELPPEISSATVIFCHKALLDGDE
jgi:hypothetical protein